MSNKAWGGRFETQPEEWVDDFNASIDFDKNLILYLITPLQTFIYFILLMFITQSQMVRQWLKPAEKVGKTAFTNFILQAILLNLIIRIFFNSNCPTPSESILISVITILIMSVLTKVLVKML